MNVKLLSKSFAVLSVFAIASLGLSACEDGPAEKAGETVDEAVDDAGDAMEDAGDSVEDAADEATE